MAERRLVGYAVDVVRLSTPRKTIQLSLVERWVTTGGIEFSTHGTAGENTCFTVWAKRRRGAWRLAGEPTPPEFLRDLLGKAYVEPAPLVALLRERMEARIAALLLGASRG